MDEREFRGDCTRCSGLCCVALAFDRGPLFALDKAAGTPCVHLAAAGSCGIHGERGERGFAGCVAFDCLGAGQRTTAMFAGLSWRDGPAVARAMFRAFAMLRTMQALRLAALRLDMAEVPAPPERYADLLRTDLPRLWRDVLAARGRNGGAHAPDADQTGGAARALLGESAPTGASPMEKHVHVIDGNGDILTTYPINLGVDEAEIREAEYFEEARRRARDENLVEHEAEIAALRFQFATGPR